MHGLARLSMASILLAACAWGAAAHPFVDSSRAELVEAAPELSALAFDADQSGLDPLLRATGGQLEGMLAKFVDVSMAEDVHEMRFDSAHMLWKEHRDRFRYVITAHPFAELRRQAKGPDAAQPNAKSPFLIAGSFEETLAGLIPENQNQDRFRYLGRIGEGGGASLVVAFLARDGTREGLVWVDEATKRIVRVRTDALTHPDGARFETFTLDVRFAPVNFSALETTPWLPTRATAHVRFATGELHSVHRFSDYHADEKDAAGKVVGPVGMEEDGFEAMLQGVAAIEGGKPGDAVKPLRDAAGRLPERAEPGYYLGLALFETRDWAGAEAQFRETVKRSPNFAGGHDGVGVALLERGDRAGAVAEFQEALRLEPGNVKVRANLDAAARGAEDRGTAPAPPAGEATIQVNVRQVLVPVVVTDRDGRHVTGLTRTDFKVFEDGVEQKITAFASERADGEAPADPGAAARRSDAVAAAAPNPPVKGHADVICLDMTHASFANFVYVRNALRQLFEGERAGDSQYAVIALGRTMEIVQNTTSDPAKVLETLGGADFRKIFQQSQKGSSEADISRYESALRETRAACDSGDPSCESRKRALPSDANNLAESERNDMTRFLAQFRSVVEQLARGDARHTLILISDGFLLAPGEIPFTLLETYFPEFRSTRGLENMHDSMEPIFRLAEKGNVPIYTIDSRGLYTSRGFDASRGGASPSVGPQVDRAWDGIATDEGLTLSEIAAATGGAAYRNSNDLLAGMKRAFADGREYYLLSYVPANAAQDGKFRKIEVRVRDSKAGVSAKRGYWASSQGE